MTEEDVRKHLEEGYDAKKMVDYLVWRHPETLGKSIELFRNYGLELRPIELVEKCIECITQCHAESTDPADDAGSYELGVLIEGLSSTACDLQEVADYLVEHGRFCDLFFSPRSNNSTPALRHTRLDMNKLSQVSREKGLYHYFLGFLLSVDEDHELEPEVDLKREVDYAMMSGLANLVAVIRYQDLIAQQDIELDPHDLLMRLLVHEEASILPAEKYPMNWVCRLVPQAYVGKYPARSKRPTPAEFWREITDSLPEPSRLALRRAIAVDRWGITKESVLMSGEYITEEDRQRAIDATMKA